MSPFRLLYIQPVGEKGGMEVDLVNEIRHLDRTRFSPIVACLQDGPVVNDLRALGATVYVIPRGRLRNLPRTLLTVFRLLRLMKQHNISLVISQNTYAHIFSRPAAFLGGKPAILRTGGVANPLDRVDRTAFALGASAVIANSEFTRGALITAGVPSDRIRMIHYGLVQSDFEPRSARGALRHELGLLPDAPVVTMVGRLQHWKGQHVAIAAARRVVDQFPGTRFLIVGDALFGIEREYPERLRALVRELDLSQDVMMLGHRTDIPAILAASDVVLVPSVKPEPFGIVVIEAMAAGKPVVASDAGGPPEIIAHGETGLLVTPNAPEALANAVMQLLDSAELRRAMGNRAQQVVRERFTIERELDQYAQVYLEFVEPDSSAS